MRGRSVSVNVVISSPSTPLFSEGVKRLSVVTYGRPHHETSAVDMPLVPNAAQTNAPRAIVGSVDSMTKMNGARVVESVSEATENILSRRNVLDSGPS